MSMEEIEPFEYPKTEEEIDTLISTYKEKSTCSWCGSDNIDFPFRGYRRCGECGKHSLYGIRFSFFEVDKNNMYTEISGQTIDRREDITFPMVKGMIELVDVEYDEKNRQPGSKYYRNVLLVNKLSLQEKEVEKL